MLKHRDIIVPVKCPLCLQSLETIKRLFIDYSITQHIWQEVQQLSWIPGPGQSVTLSQWLHSLLLSINNDKLSIFTKICYLLWSIWKNRNNVVFRNESFQPSKCFYQAHKVALEWLYR